MTSAGFTQETLFGQDTGVFVAMRLSGEQAYSPLSSNRISYSLGLLGPSITLDTACSSALVAADQAFRSIKHQSCSSALVASESRIAPQVYFELDFFQQQGRCRTFDECATGSISGEGCGAVVMQSQTTAIDGSILSRVLGSAFGHSGLSARHNVPSGISIQRMF